MAWLAHPITLTALVVLVVNDHLLKTAVPGLLTGKLSDVAGLIVGPPLLATLILLTLRRLPAGVVAVTSTAVVGLGFTVTKATQAGAAAASAAWSLVMPGSVMVADPTDLPALCALGAAWCAWLRAGRRPVDGRVVRLVRVCVVLPTTMLAVAATSPVQTGVAVDVVDVDGTIVLGEAGASDSRNDGELDWVYPSAISRDGVTWASGHGAVGTLDMQRAMRNRTSASQSCRPTDPQDCYRVVPGRLAIEHRTGAGDWGVAWQVSTRDRASLMSNGESYLQDLYECRSVLVHEVGPGYVVLAACGADGYVRRGVDGGWARIGFPLDRGPVDPATISPGLFNLDSALAGGAAALLALIVGLWAVRPYTGHSALTWTFGALDIGCLLPLAVRFQPFQGGLIGFMIVPAELMAQVWFFIPFIVSYRQERGLRWDVVGAAIVTGVATGLLPYLAFQGIVPPYAWIWPGAAVLAAIGIASTVVLARRPGSSRASNVEAGNGAL